MIVWTTFHHNHDSNGRALRMTRNTKKVVIGGIALGMGLASILCWWATPEAATAASAAIDVEKTARAVKPRYLPPMSSDATAAVSTSEPAVASTPALHQALLESVEGWPVRCKRPNLPAGGDAIVDDSKAWSVSRGVYYPMVDERWITGVVETRSGRVKARRNRPRGELRTASDIMDIQWAVDDAGEASCVASAYVSVEFQLEGPEGFDLEGFRVYSQTGYDNNRNTTDSKGRIQVFAPPGEHTFWVQDMERLTTVRSDEVLVSVRSDHQEVVRIWVGPDTAIAHAIQSLDVLDEDSKARVQEHMTKSLEDSYDQLWNKETQINQRMDAIKRVLEQSSIDSTDRARLEAWLTMEHRSRDHIQDQMGNKEDYARRELASGGITERPYFLEE